MKNIPMFTTEKGVASLILREVPCWGVAYVRLQSVQPGQEGAFALECAQFCRAAGAERVYATGAGLEKFPLHCTVLSMVGQVCTEPTLRRNFVPVTEQTVGQWRSIYNQRMAAVDNATSLTKTDETRLCSSGGAGFVREKEQLLGIGWLEQGRLLALASVQPGAGERVAHTVLAQAEGRQVTLEVASTNIRAIRLYERLGFQKTGELSRWYELHREK